jgi:archaellum component FlaC
MEEQIASIREELKGQAKQLVEEREKCENLAKEHKITMRRCNAIS